MKKKLFGLLQRIGRSLMLPIAIMPIAGFFLGLGSSLTNETTIASIHMQNILYKGNGLYSTLLLLKLVGQTLFNSLPLFFAASIASGLSKKAKEVAVISSIIAFFAMHSTIHALLNIYGVLDGNEIIKPVLAGQLTNVFGQMSLQMGVFGGIIIGLGVSFLHNRYYQIQLPDVLSFFEGERFIPIISTVASIFLGFIFFHIWPMIQQLINSLGTFINSSGYAGTFIYGLIKRGLVPFGLHHVFYMPFYQTAIGGTMMVSGELVSGAQNIFFAQLADPNLSHFSVEATKYFSGEFMIMMFGLPGGALAMYHLANDDSKKVVKGLLLSGVLTSFLTGITEPIEFTFVFVAPILFGVHVVLAASAFVVAQLLKVTIGFTFSCGFIDFLVFGMIQGQEKTHWIYIIVMGVLYFSLYYVIFRMLILKLDLKTPGREDNKKITIFKKKQMDYTVDESYIDPQVQMIIKGLGGRHNFSELDCCITRLRTSLDDVELVKESLLKQAGAAGIMIQGNAIQIIFGPKASSLKTKIEDYLEHIPESYDEKKQISYQNKTISLCNIVDGEVLPIEDCVDDLFACKAMGDGVMIRPFFGDIHSPCDGTITMIYPTKHAIGIKIDDHHEILLHFGINTVSLQGQGFEVLVEVGQQVKTGDMLWNVDLQYIKKHAVDDCILFVLTKTNASSLDKHYGMKTSNEVIIDIKE